MFLLHVHESHGEHITVDAFYEEVLLHGILDTLKILPFLFLTYLLMEFLEHRASSKTLAFMKKTGDFGPLFGGLFGALPQCAFSAVASNLYTGKVITLGTLIAVFLSTSDEMLPILIGGNADAVKILILLSYKVGVAIVIGFAADLILKLKGKQTQTIDIDSMCTEERCNCEGGILFSAIYHTFKIISLIFVLTLLINAAVFFIGTEALAAVLKDLPVLSHFLCALIGLIPGCATSVAISTLGLRGIISAGTMLAGLFPNAGVGIIVLLRFNKNRKENILIIVSIVLIGFLFGLLADVIGITV